VVLRNYSAPRNFLIVYFVTCSLRTRRNVTAVVGRAAYTKNLRDTHKVKEVVTRYLRHACVVG
jgi:hypothetical protein